jgi:hypothetical protein
MLLLWLVVQTIMAVKPLAFQRSNRVQNRDGLGFPSGFLESSLVSSRSFKRRSIDLRYSSDALASRERNRTVAKPLPSLSNCNKTGYAFERKQIPLIRIRL